MKIGYIFLITETDPNMEFRGGSNEVQKSNVWIINNKIWVYSCKHFSLYTVVAPWQGVLIAKWGRNGLSVFNILRLLVTVHHFFCLIVLILASAVTVLRYSEASIHLINNPSHGKNLIPPPPQKKKTEREKIFIN